MLTNWWRSWRPSVMAGCVAFVVFWVVTEAIALISLHTGTAAGAPAPSGDPLNDVWNRWDSGWYLLIASSGYTANAQVAVAPGVHQDAAAFAPLYPLLIRAGVRVLRLSDVGVASLISNGALLLGLMVTHRLARHELPDNSPRLALLLLLVFPSAFFLRALYPESLLLLFVAGCLLAARRRHWWLASLLAGIAVLTKAYSVILVVPLAIEYFESHEWFRRPLDWNVLAPVAGPALAVAALTTYMQVRLGDAFRFVHAEALWGHAPAGPWTAVGHNAALLAATDAALHERLLAAFDLLSPFLLLAAAAYALLRSFYAYAALMLLAALVFLSSTVLQSSGRYTLTVVPLFLMTAHVLRGHRIATAVLATLSAALGVFFLHAFALNRFVG